MLWPPDEKSWLIGKYSDDGKDRRWEKKGTTKDEMAGWHHRLRWMRVWVISGSWWWTGRPGVLQSMGLQRVGHDWATELNWLYFCFVKKFICSFFKWHDVFVFFYLTYFTQCGILFNLNAIVIHARIHAPISSLIVNLEFFYQINALDSFY